MKNLVDEQPQRARAYRSGIEQQLRLEQAARRGAESATATLPPDMLEKLGALGYVSGSASAKQASGADPKDKIEEYKTLNTLMREGLVSLREKRYGESLARFQSLFGHGVDSFESHYYAARALTGLERWREAAVHYQGAIDKLPSYTAAYLGLADADLADGRFNLALDAVRRGQKAAPDDPRLVEREGDIERGSGGRDAAARAYERVGQMAPRDALVRIKLGEVYRDLGRPADAARVMREAIKLDPATASYWNALGMVLGGADDLPGAEQAFREAATRDARNAQYAYNLGLALERQQQRDAAVTQFRRALALDPRFAPARQRLGELR